LTANQVNNSIVAINEMIGVHGMEADLLKMIQGIRILSVNEKPDEAFQALC
jgi:hypothetical protein